VLDSKLAAQKLEPETDPSSESNLEARNLVQVTVPSLIHWQVQIVQFQAEPVEVQVELEIVDSGSSCQ
jgi:hypothetical protein